MACGFNLLRLVCRQDKHQDPDNERDDRDQLGGREQVVEEEPAVILSEKFDDETKDPVHDEPCSEERTVLLQAFAEKEPDDQKNHHVGCKRDQLRRKNRKRGVLQVQQDVACELVFRAQTVVYETVREVTRRDLAEAAAVEIAADPADPDTERDPEDVAVDILQDRRLVALEPPDSRRKTENYDAVKGQTAFPEGEYRERFLDVDVEKTVENYMHRSRAEIAHDAGPKRAACRKFEVESAPFYLVKRKPDTEDKSDQTHAVVR